MESSGGSRFLRDLVQCVLSLLITQQLSTYYLPASIVSSVMGCGTSDLQDSAKVPGGMRTPYSTSGFVTPKAVL
eukprot:3844852-Amphidinium_carterae.1